MFLFKSHGDALPVNELASFSGFKATDAQFPSALYTGLFGEERPSHMLILLSILVLLLHVWGLVWLLTPAETTTPAKPLIMDVSMISISVPKPEVAPPPPAPAPPPPPEKKPLPKKPEPKPVLKKAPPVVQQKAPDFAPVEQIVEPPPVAQASPSAVTDSTPAPAKSESFTEANYHANYAHNPKPEYPSIARSRGWKGRVMLRVQVSADGLSESVVVEHSSGHEMLDEAAIEAVKQWKFIPAKRGETAVASSVLVPIDFKLTD